MPRYKKGDRWSARDASMVYDGVKQILGYQDLLGSGANILFGKVINNDIVPDTITGEAELWDLSVSPPAAVSPQQTVTLTFDWLSDQKISIGKEIAWTRVGDFDRILFAECETPSINIYDDGGTPPATITPGNTARLPLSETALVLNPAFTIVGGNSLQALRDINLSFGLASSLEYVASGNNQEIQIRGDIVTVSGTPTIVPIPLVDSFQTTRVGTFGRSHQLPSGIVSFTAGDTIAFDFTNDVISTMDLSILGYILNFEGNG